MNVNGLFSSEQVSDPFDTSVFDTATNSFHNYPTTPEANILQKHEPVLENMPKLDMDFIAELEKSLGKKEAQANTNKQVVLAPPNVAPKKLNTEHSNTAIPRPSSSININNISASSNYCSSTEFDMSSLVSKYDSDPIYAANLNMAENKVKELGISDIPSNKNTNSTSSNYYRNNLYSNIKTDNLTVVSSYNNSPYYSPPVDPSRYYSQTPNMYQIVPESNTVIFSV